MVAGAGFEPLRNYQPLIKAELVFVINNLSACSNSGNIVFLQC